MSYLFTGAASRGRMGGGGIAPYDVRVFLLLLLFVLFLLVSSAVSPVDDDNTPTPIMIILGEIVQVGKNVSEIWQKVLGELRITALWFALRYYIHRGILNNPRLQRTT